MNKLMDRFVTAVNNATQNSVPVVDGADGLPETTQPAVSKMTLSADLRVMNPEEFGASCDDVDQTAAMEAGGDGEVRLDFGKDEQRLPYVCASYDELATVAVGNVMRSEGLGSVNVSFFGSVLQNANADGCSRVRFGRHEFFVRDRGDAVTNVFRFLQDTKEELVRAGRYECPLVKAESVNGARAYSLVLTPKEFLDVQRSYPEYELSWLPGESVERLKLVVRVRRS